MVAVAVPRPSVAALSLALPHKDYPHAAQVVVLPATNAEANLYFGPAHRSRFSQLHRIDGAGWIQAALWHFKTGLGGATQQHQAIFAYAIHVFKGKRGAKGALKDVKLKTYAARIGRLYARRFKHSDARGALSFVFFTYREILVESYYQYNGVAPATTARMIHRYFSAQAAQLSSVVKALHTAIHRPPTPLPTPTYTITPSPTATATSIPATSTPTPVPSASPVPTATRMVSPTPTLTPTPGALTVQAKPGSPSYPPGGEATVGVHVTLGSVPLPGATVLMSFYLPNEAALCTVTTDANGDASCSVLIPANATNGTPVSVTIDVQGPQNQSTTTTTSFTIRSS